MKSIKSMFEEIENTLVEDTNATVKEVLPFMSSKVEEELDYAEKCHELEDDIGLSLETLIAICDNTQPIKIDKEHVGLEFQRDRWRKVKICIPDSFNSASIKCDVWYGENYTGGVDRLVIPIKEFGKTWWLVDKEKSE